jgi:uncharacterized membrane protein
MRRLWIVALLVSCGSWTEIDEVECPPAGTTLTYENWAQGFFGAWCQRCHGAAVEDRDGAPRAYVFDTHDQVVALQDRIFLRSAAENATMPPGPDDPPQEERDKLAEWIACGAPAE